MFSLYDTLFNLYTQIASIAYGYATQFLKFLIFGIEALFSNKAVLQYQSFVAVFADFLFLCGVGFAIANWAISVNEGTSESIMTTFKNCIIGLVATLGFVIIPVNLLRFTAECCQLIIADMSLDAITNQITDVISSDITVVGVLIYPLFTIITLVCLIKIFLSNIKRGGTLLILLTICPIHIFSIPRGHTEGFYSWCKQVLALCLTTFVQNFLVSLSFLIIATSSEISIINVVMSLGVCLASMEAPRFMDRLGLDTSLSVNLSSGVSAINTASAMIDKFV